MSIIEDSLLVSVSTDLAVTPHLHKGIAALAATAGLSCSATLLHGQCSVSATANLVITPHLHKGSLSVEATPSLLITSHLRKEELEAQGTANLAITPQIIVARELILSAQAELRINRSHQDSLSVSSTATVDVSFGSDLLAVADVSMSAVVLKGLSVVSVPALEITPQIIAQRLLLLSAIAGLEAIAYIPNTTGYNPFQAGGSGGCGKPPETMTITTRETVILMCETANVVFRRPELGNIEAVDPRHITRRSRGGDLIHFRACTWPTEYVHRFKITNLRQNEAEAWITFLKASLGKEVRYTDHESRQWIGVILNPTDAIRELRTNAFEINVEYSAEQVP